MKKYLALMRASILESLQFRLAAISNFVGNLIYIVIVYNLWKSIFESAGSESINGLTFADTMVYLVLASALFYAMEVYFVWETHRSIQSGKIILDLIKPIKYHAFQFASLSGWVVFNFISTFIPTFALVYFLSGRGIPLGFNLLFFMASVGLAIGIHFSIDSFVATICLYTQSVWGVNIMKEVIVLLFSGAVIPLNFFPEPLKTIAMYLPFQAIYNSPLQQLINPALTMHERLVSFGIQAFWLMILLLASSLFWKKSLKVITVNGG